MSHNRLIYHCQNCGAVVVEEPYRVPPFCCGHEMTKAAEESLPDNFAHELDFEPEIAKPPTIPHQTVPDRQSVRV